MDQNVREFLASSGDDPTHKVVVFDERMNHLRFNSGLNGTLLDGRFLIPWDGVQFDENNLELWFTERTLIRVVNPEFKLHGDTLDVSGDIRQFKDMFNGKNLATPAKLSILKLDEQDLQLIELIKKYKLVTFTGDRMEEIRRRANGKRLVNRVTV